mgnify:CR=1 FL=1
MIKEQEQSTETPVEEEVAIGLRDTFYESGGENFTFIPCLNSGDAGLKVLEHQILRELNGWFPALTS